MPLGGCSSLEAQSHNVLKSLCGHCKILAFLAKKKGSLENLGRTSLALKGSWLGNSMVRGIFRGVNKRPVTQSPDPAEDPKPEPLT